MVSTGDTHSDKTTKSRLGRHLPAGTVASSSGTKLIRASLSHILGTKPARAGGLKESGRESCCRRLRCAAGAARRRLHRTFRDRKIHLLHDNLRCFSRPPICIDLEKLHRSLQDIPLWSHRHFLCPRTRSRTGSLQAIFRCSKSSNKDPSDSASSICLSQLRIERQQHLPAH